MKRLRTFAFVLISLFIMGACAYLLFNALITRQMRAASFVQRFGWPTASVLGYGSVWDESVEEGDKEWQIDEIIRCSKSVGLTPSPQSIGESQGFMYCLLYAIPGQEVKVATLDSLIDSGVALVYADIGINSKKRVDYAYIRILGKDGRVMYVPISYSEDEILALWKQSQRRLEQNDSNNSQSSAQENTENDEQNNE